MDEWDSLILRYLCGESSDTERKIIENWIELKQENKEHFQRIQKLWELSAVDADQFTPDVSRAIKSIQSKIDAAGSRKVVHLHPSHRSSSILYYAKRLAAVVIISVGVYWAFQYVNRQNVHEASYISAVSGSSQKQELLLEDGTKIWLNENSKIRYPEKFGNETREVFLEGEAYFEVAKDPTKPFRIFALSSVTQVLGTAFNVRANPKEEKIIVTVTSGKVSFTTSAEKDKIYLLKGDRGVLIKKENSLLKEKNEDLNFLSWQTGKIIFKDSPFDQVAGVLSQFYHKKISIEGNLSSCRLTSSFDHETLTEVLDELKAQGIEVKLHEDKIILSGQGC